MENKKDINLGVYKVINISGSDINFYTPITPYTLFTSKVFAVKENEFPEEFKKFKKIYSISEAISFFCEVFDYSVVSVSYANNIYTITLKKEFK